MSLLKLVLRHFWNYHWSYTSCSLGTFDIHIGMGDVEWKPGSWTYGSIIMWRCVAKQRQNSNMHTSGAVMCTRIPNGSAYHVSGCVHAEQWRHHTDSKAGRIFWQKKWLFLSLIVLNRNHWSTISNWYHPKQIGILQYMKSREYFVRKLILQYFFYHWKSLPFSLSIMKCFRDISLICLFEL